ncbi:MAG TPA: hypothetical protein DCL77_10575 [Prolixibacteraceae bacterium]|jgi:hypothetical protein|nr:hypothetical protein [Prolixibacteraceae bacterium]
MKQNKKGQQGKNAKTGEKKNQGKADLSKGARKHEDVSVAENPEEPAIPTTPRREYEDPGHEHVYQPPTANPSPSESTHGYVGE